MPFLRAPSITAMAALVACTSVAAAQDQKTGARAGVHTRQTEPNVHDGLFLRLTVGPSWSIASEEEGVMGFGHAGLGYYGSLWVGAAVADGVVLAADMTVSEAATPLGDVPDELSEPTFGIGVLGVGLGWFFADGYHVGLSLGAGLGSAEHTDVNAAHWLTDSEVGFGTHLMLGREWWLGPELAIGLALDGLYVAAPVGELDEAPTLHAGSVGIGVSMTYSP